jgi:outer membrane protein TolC
MIHRFLLYLLISIPLIAKAQTPALSLSDTAFYRMVLLYHPVVKQAGLLLPSAQAEIQIARGLFDPVLAARYSDKEYDEKTYWKQWEGGLIIPLFPGIDLKAGYTKDEGEYVNPEETTPENGLVSAGVKVPLGQGLFMDERRNTLGQAKLYADLAEAERRKMLNKLLLDATSEYYDWYYNYNRLRWFEEFVRLSIIRYEAIRDRVIFGDLPAIDSLEALMEVENRTILLNQSRVDYLASQLSLSNFLWNDQLQPMQVTDSLMPVHDSSTIKLISTEELAALLNSSTTQHPEIVALETKLSQLDFERRWAAEKLKPKLNLEYNFLSDTEEGIYNNYNFSELEDYKFGVNFSMPLFLRSERGKLNQTKLKINHNQYQQIRIQREISNDLRQAWNEVNIFFDQVSVQKRQLVLAERMLTGESERFFAGESSLFLVNTRETVLINNRVRLAELESRYHKSKAWLYWSAGNLSEINTR